MKIDKIISGEIPRGIRVAAISNKVAKRRKWAAQIAAVPHGIARTRSLYTSSHTVIPASVALEIGIPVVAFQWLP